MSIRYKSITDTGHKTQDVRQNKEALLKTKVVKMLRKEFPEFWFYKVSDRFTLGIPDIVGCYPGIRSHARFVAIELKTKTGKLTPIQNHVIRQLTFIAAHIQVCRDVQSVRDFMLYIKHLPRR